MTQAALFIVIYLVGMLVGLGFGMRDRPHLACAAAFPLGLAVATLAAMLLLGIGIPYNAWTAAAAVAIPVIAAAVSLKRRPPSRPWVRVAAAWTAAFAAVSLGLSTTNLLIMTFDSHTFVMLGRVVGQDGGFAPGTLARLHEWGAFQVVAQSMQRFTLQDFLYALAPTFGVSSLAFFAVLLWNAARELSDDRRSRLAVVLVAVALSSCYMVLRNVFYVHTNFATAVYLFGYVGLFWLAERSRDAGLLAPAFVSLLAFSVQRVETPLFAVVFLTLTIFSSKLPRRAITPLVLGYALAVAAWYELLAHHVPSDGGFLTPTRCRLVAASLLAVACVWLATARPATQRLARHLPAVAEYGVGAALLAAFIIKPEHMARSVGFWIQNLTELPEWGLTWHALVALWVIGLFLPAPRFRQSFVRGIPIALALIMLLAVLVKTYRFHSNDSANRMALHVLPLIFFYLGLELALAFGARSRTETA